MGGRITYLLLWHPKSNLKHIIPRTAPSSYCYEVKSNLSAIYTLEEAYYAEEGVYHPCKPSPPDGGTDGWPDTWCPSDFIKLGFEPSNKSVLLI